MVSGHISPATSLRDQKPRPGPRGVCSIVQCPTVAICYAVKKVSNHLQIAASRPHNVHLILTAVRSTRQYGVSGLAWYLYSYSVAAPHMGGTRESVVTRPVVTIPAHTLPVLLPTCVPFTWSCFKHNKHLSILSC